MTVTLQPGPSAREPGAARARRVRWLPTTRPGWWALALSAAGIVLVPAWRLMGPLGAFPGFVCGLGGGVVAVIAILRRRDRAVAVFAAVLPLLLVVALVVAELVVGHD